MSYSSIIMIEIDLIGVQSRTCASIYQTSINLWWSATERKWRKLIRYLTSIFWTFQWEFHDVAGVNCNSYRRLIEIVVRECSSPLKSGIEESTIPWTFTLYTMIWLNNRYLLISLSSHYRNISLFLIKCWIGPLRITEL